MDMKIKVDAKNAEKIEKALLSANGRSTRHTFTTFSDIEEVAALGDKALSRIRLQKKNWSGAKYLVRSGEALPNAYRNSRQVTFVKLQRGSTGWFLVSVQSATAWTEDYRPELFLTPDQDAAATEGFRRRNYSVIAL